MRTERLSARTQKRTGRQPFAVPENSFFIHQTIPGLHIVLRKGGKNIKSCHRLGFVGDIDFDMKTGCMTAIIVPGPGSFCGFLCREKEYVIPFCNICQVGEDIILVDYQEKEQACKGG